MRRFARLILVVIFLFGPSVLVPGAARGQGDIAFERDRMKDILGVVSKEIEKNYFDGQLKGLDWKGLTAQAREKIDKAATVSGLEISVARVVFPGSEELENRGVTPDIKCLPTGDQLRQKQDMCRSLAYVLARKALALPEEPDKTVDIKPN